MLSLYLTGRALRRVTDGYNTLAAAAFCMLAYNPYYLFDVGFQLSYLAVFFILFLVPRFKEWIVVRNPLLAMPWEWITVSIAAQIGTALLCFYYFGQFSDSFLVYESTGHSLGYVFDSFCLFVVRLSGGFLWI